MGGIIIMKILSIEIGEFIQLDSINDCVKTIPCLISLTHVTCSIVSYQIIF